MSEWRDAERLTLWTVARMQCGKIGKAEAPGQWVAPDFVRATDEC